MSAAVVKRLTFIGVLSQKQGRREFCSYSEFKEVFSFSVSAEINNKKFQIYERESKKFIFLLPSNE